MYRFMTRYPAAGDDGESVLVNTPHALYGKLIDKNKQTTVWNNRSRWKNVIIRDKM